MEYESRKKLAEIAEKLGSWKDDLGEEVEETEKRYAIYTDLIKKNRNDFEYMMDEFWNCVESETPVLVIDRKCKKVVCAYTVEGKVTFNRSLLDGAVYFNDRNDEDEMPF